jgi:predicted phage-related endonuclease
MKMVAIGDEETKWRYARSKIITSTDLAAILGLNPNRSRFAVWVDKRLALGTMTEGLAAERQAQADAPTEPMIWGRILEEPVAQEVARRIGRRFKDHGRYTMFVNQDLPFPFGATPDREILGAGATPDPEVFHDGPTPFPPFDGPGWYEGKTFGTWADPERAWDDEGPALYLVQLQGVLLATGGTWGILGGLGSGQNLKIHEHQRDETFLSWCVEEVARFWHDNVIGGVAPPIDGSDSSHDALSRLYPGRGEVVDLPIAALPYLDAYSRALSAEAVAAHDKAEAAARLKQFMGEAGDATTGLVPGQEGEALEVRWRWTKTPKPELCRNCLEPTNDPKPSRRFSLGLHKPEKAR